MSIYAGLPFILSIGNEAQRSSSKDDVDCDDQSVGDEQSDSTFTTSTDDMLLSMYDTETVKKKNASEITFT